MQFAFILNGFGQKMNNWLNSFHIRTKYMHDYITLGFAENVQFAKKGIGNLS